MYSQKHKTKIVATIGPATDTVEKMIRLIENGMTIARLNYSHETFEKHALVIKDLRKASEIAKRSISILADLPGPKMRVGKLDTEVILLNKDDHFILTSEKIIGDKNRVSVSFERLPEVVASGDVLYLNDGIIQLIVEKVELSDVHCRVVVGGELRSHKGLNLPGINLGISAFTDHDYNCLKSALENGVDAVSQSFVNNADDVLAVRSAAQGLGYNPFIVAKIERAGALDNLDEILYATDGIMIARGDLGVEIPIEKIAIIQKHIISRANLYGKPVITATQMLASMTGNPRPTRAEVTDVSNAILDGTDCIMLSEESALGQYPFEAVNMLAKIAVHVELPKPENANRRRGENYYRTGGTHVTDTISYNVQQTVNHLKAVSVVIHTMKGHLARMISRFKIPVWILAVTEDKNVFQGMHFSYGVHPIFMEKSPDNWTQFIKENVFVSRESSGIVIMVAGPSKMEPLASHRMEIIDLKNPT